MSLLLKRLEEAPITPPQHFSFEFFPPSNDAMEKSLWRTITELEPLAPDFVSVTYGAGGSTRKRTHQTIKRILDETNLTPAAHLTCVNASQTDINDIAQNYWDMGVKHIVALRGDPPGGASRYTPHPDGYPYSVDLVKGLRNIADFEISVAAFPEKHPEALSMDSDLDYLKQKIDAGATRAITQFFFDTDAYLRFIDKARDKGITQPIVPGILLIANFKQFLNFAKRCQASIPKWVSDLFASVEETPELQHMISAIIATEQCRILRAAGIDQFHFYTLNRPVLTRAVCQMIGIRPVNIITEPKYFTP